MSSHMKTDTVVSHAGKATWMAILLCAAGCAATVPKELNDAREAYTQAEKGPAAEHNPAQLHTAHQSLTLAEQTFNDEGDTSLTRDRAYVAMRKAQLADVQGRSSESRTSLEAMEKKTETAQVAELAQAKGALQTSEQGRKSAEEARKSAEAKAAAANLELARLASVKHEDRGTVITLSGSVLFASDKAELLPAAQQRLTDVAKALNEGSSESQMMVEGHTDGQGSASYNLDLSARRADAVRRYLVSQGIAEGRIRSEGLGFSRPIADNKNAEGRANNRRVEIVIQGAKAGS